MQTPNGNVDISTLIFIIFAGTFILSVSLSSMSKLRIFWRKMGRFLSGHHKFQIYNFDACTQLFFVSFLPLETFMFL